MRQALAEEPEKLMPIFEVYFHCVFCAGDHSLLMKVHLDNGPERQQTVGEFFPGSSVSPQISAIHGHDALCLRTGKKFKLENDDQLLLVSTAV
jgi:hypothetical protein